MIQTPGKMVSKSRNTKMWKVIQITSNKGSNFTIENYIGYSRILEWFLSFLLVLGMFYQSVVIGFKEVLHIK